MIGPLQVEEFDSQGGMVGKKFTLSYGIQSACLSVLRYLKQQIDQTMRLILNSLIIVFSLLVLVQKNNGISDVWRA